MTNEMVGRDRRFNSLRNLMRPRAFGMAIAALALAATSAVNAQRLPDAQTQDGPIIRDFVDGPQLTLSIEEYDWGMISDLQKAHYQLAFRNTGTGMLTISDVHASCGCTAAALAIRDYLPGEGGVIEVTFDPTGRRGAQHKVLTINSNDPANPTQRVNFAADVKPVVDLDSTNLAFGQIIYGQGATKSLTLRSDRAKLLPGELRIVGSNLTGKVGEVREVKLEDGSTIRELDLTFTLDPSTPMGWFTRQVTLSTVINDDTGKDVDYEVRFSATANIVGEIDARPQRVAFGTPLPNTEFRREIRLVSRTDRPFEVLDVELEPAPAQLGQEVEMTIEHGVIDVSEEKVHQIVLAGVTPSEPGSFRGMIVVHTDLEGQEEIKIPYFGHVRPNNAGPIIGSGSGEDFGDPATDTGAGAGAHDGHDHGGE